MYVPASKHGASLSLQLLPAGSISDLQHNCLLIVFFPDLVPHPLSAHLSHLDEQHFRALFEESLNVSSQIWMTGTNEAIFKKLESSSKLQYFVINDSNITQLVDM